MQYLDNLICECFAQFSYEVFWANCFFFLCVGQFFYSFKDIEYFNLSLSNGVNFSKCIFLENYPLHLCFINLFAQRFTKGHMMQKNFFCLNSYFLHIISNFVHVCRLFSLKQCMNFYQDQEQGKDIHYLHNCLTLSPQLFNIKMYCFSIFKNLDIKVQALY